MESHLGIGVRLKRIEETSDPRRPLGRGVEFVVERGEGAILRVSVRGRVVCEFEGLVVGTYRHVGGFVKWCSMVVIGWGS